jgi:hypothetical protein
MRCCMRSASDEAAQAHACFVARGSTRKAGNVSGFRPIRNGWVFASRALSQQLTEQRKMLGRKQATAIDCIGNANLSQLEP